MKRDFIAFAIVFAVIGLFGKEILLDRQSPHRGDIAVQFYPWKSYARSTLAAGEIPYWNPYTHGGAPFMANMQSAVFYPLDLLLFFFPMERFFGFSLLLHLWLAGAGTYLLARRCGASSLPSVIAGVAYGLNGFTMIHLPAGNHLTYAGAAWAPWLLWASVGFMLTEKSRLPWALVGSLITCLHFLCGHPQMTFYSLVFSVLLCVVLGVVSSIRERPLNFFVPIFRTIAWGLFLVFGIALAGFQFFPTWEYLGWANRATSIGLEAATEFSFAPHRLVTLFFPEYYGTFIGRNHYDSFVYWSCAYAGVIVPALAVALFFVGKKRPKAAIPLAVVGGVALFIAWGRGNPFYAFLYQLPGFGYFRAPAKYLPYYLVPICVLASLGLDRLCVLAYETQQKKRRSEIDIFRISGLIILLIVIFFYGASIFNHLTGSLRNTDGVEDPDMIRSLSLACGGLIGLSAVAIYLFARRIPKYPRLVLSLSMLFILCLDLFTFGKGYLHASLQRTDRIRSHNTAPQEAGVMKGRGLTTRPERVATLREVDYPNLFISWRIPNISGYDPMSLLSYNRSIGQMEGWEEGAFHDNIPLTQIDDPVLDQLNVRYVLTLQTFSHPKLSLIYQGRDFRIYERKSENRCWASSVLWNKVLPSKNAPWRNADKDIRYEKLTPHEIVFSYVPGRREWLKVSEWAYPGWLAEVSLMNGDRLSVKTETSENGFRLLDLPKETQEVRLFYSPPVLGWVVSVLAWMVFLVLGGIYLILRMDYGLRIVQFALGRRDD